MPTNREKQKTQARQTKKTKEKVAAQTSKGAQTGKPARRHHGVRKYTADFRGGRKVSKRTATNRPDEKFGF